VNVLIGCECSGRLRRAFRGRGIEAWSNDIKPAEDDSQWHIQGDVMLAIASWQWDMIILHPDCTAMSLSGNKHYAADMPKHDYRLNAIEWTLNLWDYATDSAPMVAMENPASVIFPHLRKRGAIVQFIHPHHFGHPEFKATGFALHGLPELIHTNPLKPPEKGTDMYKEWERVFRMAPSPERATERSRTYLGIADAIAEKWSRPGLSCQQMEAFA
jgi:hypothetical protein